MKSLIYLKILALVIALVGVIFVINRLSSDSVSRSFQAMGIEAGTKASPGLVAAGRAADPGEERYNICRTRIHSINWPDGRKVEEHKQGLKLTWQAFDPNARDLNYLEIEKWFSRHCQVNVKPIESAQAEAKAYTNYLSIEYIDSVVIEVRRSPDGIFRLENRFFESADLASAVDELAGIAQLVAEKP